VYYPTGQGPNDRGLSRKHILASVDASLRRLGTDHAGKARYIGASIMRAWQFAKAQHTARAVGSTAFVSMQNRYNLLNREDEREMIPLCLDQGVGIIPYSPLARGLLAGTRERSGERHTLRSGTDDPAGRPPVGGSGWKRMRRT
jgi:aryl-alcohol dehydrogenase-like predicted oxidoreductase